MGWAGTAVMASCAGVLVGSGIHRQPGWRAGTLPCRSDPNRPGVFHRWQWHCRDVRGCDQSGQVSEAVVTPTSLPLSTRTLGGRASLAMGETFQDGWAWTGPELTCVLWVSMGIRVMGTSLRLGEIYSRGSIHGRTSSLERLSELFMPRTAKYPHCF